MDFMNHESMSNFENLLANMPSLCNYPFFLSIPIGRLRFFITLWPWIKILCSEWSMQYQLKHSVHSIMCNRSINFLFSPVIFEVFSGVWKKRHVVFLLLDVRKLEALDMLIASPVSILNLPWITCLFNWTLFLQEIFPVISVLEFYMVYVDIILLVESRMQGR